jgi:hypothetical protein
MPDAVLRLLGALVLVMAASGCAVVGGIFKAGFVVGVLAVVVIGIVVLMLFKR